MDAVMLVLEGVGILMVMRWVVGGDGSSGILAWRAGPKARANQTSRRDH